MSTAVREPADPNPMSPHEHCAHARERPDQPACRHGAAIGCADIDRASDAFEASYGLSEAHTVEVKPS